jgi:hypothetical protein
VRPDRDHQPRQLIANETTKTLIGMAQEKVVEVVVDRDVAKAPDAGCFDKIELTGERTLAITYRKDRVNAGDVLAALQKGRVRRGRRLDPRGGPGGRVPEPHPGHGHGWLSTLTTSSSSAPAPPG